MRLKRAADARNRGSSGLVAARPHHDRWPSTAHTIDEITHNSNTSSTRYKEFTPVYNFSTNRTDEILESIVSTNLTEHINYDFVNTNENFTQYPTNTNDSSIGFVNRVSLENTQVCNQKYRESLKRGYFETNTRENFTLAANVTLKANDNEVAFADSPATPQDEEERMLEQSDTDEASESGPAAPPGIVNPNYPGFQHLAHTLQDYSKTIESFYQYENEMTDDDLDAETIDSSYDPKEEDLYLSNEIENNNNNEDLPTTQISESCLESKELKKESIDLHYVDVISNNKNNTNIGDQIPDLLRNIGTSNENGKNDDNSNIDFSDGFDTDIENTFKEDITNIIGDFNREVEEELNNIFKCNLKFQEDLIGLRKDIEIAFKKPIEDTIEHISDVVNHVIKQLVIERQETVGSTSNIIHEHDNTLPVKNCITKECIEYSKKDMKLSRPTFLFIENKVCTKTADAFLSDAKDELKLNDEEYEKGNVEITCQVLRNTIAVTTNAISDLMVADGIESDQHGDNDSKVQTDRNFNEINSECSVERITLAATPHASNEHFQNTTSNQLTERKVIQKAKEKYVENSTAQESAAAMKSKRTRGSSCADPGASSSDACKADKAQLKKSVLRSEKLHDKYIGSFDVYNIETAMPKLDLDAIESHLKAAKEAERRKRNDREEIRRRLAMGIEQDEHSTHDRPSRKPSLHSRLQNGKNLQICFMNEAMSDNESQLSDSERSPSGPDSSNYMFNHPYKTKPLSTTVLRNDKTQIAIAKIRPTSLALKSSKSRSSQSLGHIPLKESDFQALQATLQTEARIALAQAKELARVHMERERRCRASSPVTEMLRRSMDKANCPLAPDRRRVSRQLLTDMNVAQLQVIVNSLHGEVEQLSESLVLLLMARDELHMSQDSMLVDIEDLTRYLGVKKQSGKAAALGGRSVRRLAAFVNK